MSNLREIITEINQRSPESELVAIVEPNFNSTKAGVLANLGLPDVSCRNALDCLKAGLQIAAQIEFSTIPPYLVALWSVIDENHPFARSLRAIVHEEMLHMALVHNMLSAIGGTPRLSDWASPQYPSALPGGIHPELVIDLSGLTSNTLDTFLEIERPLVRIPIDGVEQPSVPEVDSTISEFYETVKRTLHELAPEFSTERQVAGPLAPMVVACLDDCDKAVELILTQGEGSYGVPFDSHVGDLAHYYRFMEIKIGHHLVWNEERKVLQRAEQVKAPSVYPLAAPPAQGWGRTAPARIRWLSAEFNRLYSELLDLLEQSWREGGHRSFLSALERMFDMRELAREMIRTPGPSGAGYAPEFRYVSLDNRYSRTSSTSLRHLIE